MASVSLQNICKVYQGERRRNVVAIRDFTLEVEEGEFVVFVGPSGCGKSTALRMIAGLEEVSSGDIFIAGQRVNDVRPKDRDIAMVFQNYALYPHMTVFGNLAFGLKLRGFPRTEIQRRVREAAGVLGMEPYLERKPRELSGGQRQRVALGRAIVRQPKVFLFDEPLSNLDAKMRVQMRTEIMRLHRQLDATMIYVTHDQIEAMTMGDRIVVVNEGVVQQVDKPLVLYRAPANLFVAGFLGNPPMNFLHGRLCETLEGIIFKENGNGAAVRISMGWRAAWDAVGGEVVMGVRPEDIRILAASSYSIKPVSRFKAVVELVEPTGAETNVHLRTGAHALIARTGPSFDHHEIGQQVACEVDAAKWNIFDPLTTRRIE